MIAQSTESKLKIADTHIVGVMSGTSLDGLDLAACRFHTADFKHFEFEVYKVDNIAYNNDLKTRLAELTGKSALDYVRLDREFGFFIGNAVKDFAAKHKLKPEYIASHGHTIFHQPEKQICSQIGAGPCIAAASGITTISDFRSLDIAHGGQGAPLVPIGDRLLFSHYAYCLNLGGYANISYTDEKGRFVANDVCAVNTVFNYLCHKLNIGDYDEGGAFAAKGSFIEPLFNELNALPYFKLPKNKPKSLGSEWLKSSVLPIIDYWLGDALPEDVMRTYAEHCAYQIAESCQGTKGKLLATGGGAFNTFLMQLLEKRLHAKGVELVIPHEAIVNFKEAIIFGFLGFLRLNQMPNCLVEVTGAKKAVSGGSISMAS